MRVLWLCSIPLPSVSEKYNLKKYNIGSWIVGMKNTLLSQSDIELGYVFPSVEKRLFHDEIGGITVYSFDKSSSNMAEFRYIINDFNPDILHIFGTENPYSYAFATVFNNSLKTIVNIQGVASTIAMHYSSGLPDKVRYRHTIRDVIKRTNINSEIKKYQKCAVYEKKIIEYASNFIGRTEFDNAIVKQINCFAHYYHCNETLREEFYINKGLWSANKCEKHSVFISQAQYPVKGIHFLIEAITILKEKYSDIKLYVAGGKIRIIPESKKDYFMQTSYARYIWKLIKVNNLQDNIFFLGSLSPDEMVGRFLKANVFVSSSTIENESNSLSEAKMLGTPIVASYVGGMTNRIEHGVDGFLYQHNAPYMLGYFIDKIFADSDLGTKMSLAGIKRADNLFSIEQNQKKILEIYHEVEGQS